MSTTSPPNCPQDTPNRISEPHRIRDSGGRWHATRTLGRGGSAGGTALRVEVVPPLNRATTGIEIITTGRSAQARARLPLRWE